MKIPNAWQQILKEEVKKQYYSDLLKFIACERKSFSIYPEENKVFQAMQTTPLKDIKVVILGQDPYHGAGQANGYAFSVSKGVKIPPSLRNIFKEIHNDLLIPVPDNGDLTHWANQGVFLLNTVLTVKEKTPGSHRKKGWEQLTDKIISSVSENLAHVVFLLWGAPSQEKENLIDPEKHLVLKAPHPSPLSAFQGFFGCKHFSSANSYLIEHKKKAIDWSIPNIHPVQLSLF